MDMLAGRGRPEMRPQRGFERCDTPQILNAMSQIVTTVDGWKMLTVYDRFLVLQNQTGLLEVRG